VRRLRILTVCDVSPLSVEGGAERVLREQVRRLAARGHDVRVLGRAAPGARPTTAVLDGVRVTEFGSSQRSPVDFYLSAMREARRAAAPLLAAGDVDVLHVHQPLAGYGVLAAAAGRRLPSLYTFLSPAPLEYRSRRRMTPRHLGGAVGAAGMAALWLTERAALARATRIHVLSDFSASQLWGLYRVPAERIVKIPGAADTERLRPAADRAQVRSRLGLPLERPILLTVRNLEARMGLDVLLGAMAILVREVPDALLVIGGHGSLRAPLEQMATGLGLDKHVAFLGFVPDDDLPRYYQAADVFVLPTRELEGFGLVTVEALACGTPVLGTRVGATPELLEPLDPRLLFSAVTPEAMAGDLGAFLDRQRRDPAGAAALRAAARRHAQTRYGWDAVVGSLERTLADLVARPAPSDAPAPACDACGAAMRPSGLLYLGQRYRVCPRCRSRRVTLLPGDPEVLREYEVEYPRRFPPTTIEAPRRGMQRSLLERAGRFAAPGRLLDVGCGGGHFLAAAAADGWRGVGLDLSGESLRAARRLTAAPVAQADAAALPVRAGTLDAVALVNVLDHTRHPLDALREAARALRPGGLLIVRVPNAAFHAPWVRLLGRLGPAARMRAWDAYPVLHLFGFGPDALRRIVERAGFDVLLATNSALATAGPGRRRSGAVAAVRSLVRLATQTASTLAHAVSGGRWLVGPSIEIYARRRAEPGR
jgi:glycosyltransferase involved in cell wall biosynthesis/SAM-dependent methyltransferase